MLTIYTSIRFVRGRSPFFREPGLVLFGPARATSSRVSLVGDGASCWLGSTLASRLAVIVSYVAPTPNFRSEASRELVARSSMFERRTSTSRALA